MKLIKVLIILFVVPATFSCSEDDSIDFSKELIGSWLRSDFSDDFEFKLIFNSDNSGYRIVQEGTEETGITSSLIPFSWSVDESILSLVELDEESETSFYFNEENQLVLDNYPHLHFDKIED